MDIDFRSGEICLQNNQPVSMSDARDLRIICTDGKVWVTEAEEAGDVFLSAGQSYQVGGTGLVLVESLGAGKIRLVTPPRYSVGQRILEGAARHGAFEAA